MNKLTKVGLSALCGSLAAVASANAGEMTVTAGVDMSWMSIDGETGNPIGMGSNITFAGSGELDNGTTFDLSVANLNQDAFSAANVTVTFPTMGSLRISQGTTGAGVDRMDDMMPTAWEESHGHGIGSGLDTVGANAGGSNLEWTLPSDLIGDGNTVRVLYNPSVDGATSNDNASSGAGSLLGEGWDFTVESTALADGLKVFAGYGEHDTDIGAAKYRQTSSQEWVAGATYAIGQVTVGYQYSFDDKNQSSVDSYTNDAYGITFNVNDDLTLSYGKMESKQDVPSGTDNTFESTSVQIAYSVGGASIRFADGSVDNSNYKDRKSVV